MIEDIAILVENKSKIIDYTIDYIKRTDSWRLKKDKHVKCRRDLAYIIDAFIDDLQNNTTTSITYISNKFYHNDKLQLVSPRVELATYPKMVEFISTLGVSNSSMEKITALQTILSSIIQDGPINKTYDDYTNLLENRKQTFWWKEEIPDQKNIDQILLNLHEHMPSKQYRCRLWIKVVKNFENEERKLKIFEGTLANPDKPDSRHNPQVLAPYVLALGVREEGNTEPMSKSFYHNEAALEIGIAAAYIIMSAKAMGIDSGLCACIQERSEVNEIFGAEPRMYIGLGIRDNVQTYLDPVHKREMEIPGENNSKPRFDEYISYVQ